MPYKKEDNKPAKDQATANKLKTEGPISEKDEVKQAEEKTAGAQKQASDGVKAELKNKEKG